VPPLLPDDLAAEASFVAELTDWQEAHRRGDAEADADSVGGLARERLRARLTRWLRDGNIDRARALAIAAGLDGDPHQADLESAARLIQAGGGGDDLDRNLLQISRADLRRAGRFREVGAWGEYAGVRDLLGGRPWHAPSLVHWRRAAWAVAVEPALLATVGDGAISWPHRMLPLPPSCEEEFDAQMHRSPAWCGWHLALGVADPRTDMAPVRILGTLAGQVDGTPRAISAAINRGSVPWQGGLAQTAELALDRLMDARLDDVDPGDVPVCVIGDLYVEEMPWDPPVGDLCAVLDNCTHPHPTWEPNPPGDALRLACDNCSATALAVVPLHRAPGRAIADADAYLQRERIYAILRGDTPPESMDQVMHGSGRMSLDVDEALGRRSSAGQDLATALFG